MDNLLSVDIQTDYLYNDAGDLDISKQAAWTPTQTV